jgi:DNA-binding SARP family transcriptional activator
MQRVDGPPATDGIRLFGRPAVGDGEISSSLASTPIAILAVRADHAVEFDVLIDQLDRYEAPISAAKTIQNQIVRLRRLLGDSNVAAELETVGTANRLRIDASVVDVLRLEQVGEAVERATGANRPAETMAVLEGLRSRWRSRPFSGCRPAPLHEARLHRRPISMCVLVAARISRCWPLALSTK